MPVSPPTGNGVPCPWGCGGLVVGLEYFPARSGWRWHCSLADVAFWHYQDSSELRRPAEGEPCPHCVGAGLPLPHGMVTEVSDILGEPAYTCSEGCLEPCETLTPPTVMPSGVGVPCPAHAGELVTATEVEASPGFRSWSCSSHALHMAVPE